MTRAETITRLRNALAHLALEVLDQSRTASQPQVFQPPFSSMTAENWRRAVHLWRQHADDLIAALPTRACPACDSSRSRFLFVSYDAHPFHECNDCGCWFLPKVVDTAVFERLFELSPESRALADHMMRERDHGAIKAADLARIGGYLDDLLPLLPAQGDARRYLDAGCGVGHSLRAGLQRGLTVQGVEADTTAIAVARADGLPVTGLGESFPEGPYDLLSFWETLEHIADPFGALQQFVPHLAPDGLVAITVPNMASPAARILRESCSWIHGGYNTPGHVNLFHPASLRRLLERAGLTVLEFDGQFSNNPIEIAAYVACESRGAFDALDQSDTVGGLSPSTVAALTEIWPGAALLERLALASPILSVVACRTGRESAFAPAMHQRRQRRTAATAEAASSLIATEPDYKAIAEALQHEVNKRDRLLVEQQARFERSLEGRARALARRVLGR